MRRLDGKHVVVVGGGFGGLAAAAHLARAGARVTLLERAAHVGGKARVVEAGGFAFDVGPTLLTMPPFVDEAFAAAGTTLASHVDLTPLDPVCRYVLGGGRTLDVHRDVARTRASIARCFPADADRWEGFLAECAAIWRAAGEPYLEAPFEGMIGFSQRVLRRGPRAVALGATMGTLKALAARHFAAPEMRALVMRFATYAGASPFEASAAFAMIAHIEVSGGAFHPRGGMNAVAVALARALVAVGVDVRTGVEVTEVRVDRGRARGVVMGPVGATGEASGLLEADVVVCDVDPVRVAPLLSPAARAASQLPERWSVPSLSGFAWVFGVEGDLPGVAHHNVLFAADYAEEFRAIFQRRTVAEDPTVYVAVSPDEERAPPGHRAVYTLINAPATGDDGALWEAEAPRLRARILARLTRDLWPDVAQRIRAEAVVTPCDIARTGGAGGAIYGQAPHGLRAPFERPPLATRVRGLYLVGGATHPGGGVPLVMRGGRFVAELVAREEG